MIIIYYYWIEKIVTIDFNYFNGCCFVTISLERAFLRELFKVIRHYYCLQFMSVLNDLYFIDFNLVN